MEVIITSGDSYERGWQHGEKFKSQIKAEVAKLKNQEIYTSGESIKAIKKSWEYVAALDKRLFQEMKGISSGAGVDETAIIYLNLGFLVYSSGTTLYEWFLKDNGTVGSCSNVCFSTSIDGTVLAMNKDGGSLSQNLNYIFPAGMQDMFIHLSRATDGISTMGYTHVGKLSGYGMNEAGFCLAGTATRGTANIIENIKDKEYGINSWLLQRLLLLNCKDVLSAITLLRDLEYRGECGNFTMCDVHGKTAVVETLGTEFEIHMFNERVIATTNHWTSERMVCTAGQEVDMKRWTYQNESELRRNNILQATKTINPPSVTALKLIMSSHQEHAPVCRHGQEAANGMHTYLSFICIPSKGEFQLSEGYPCNHPYKSYYFK